MLQKHYGSGTIKSELEKIKTYIEPEYHKYIDDIAQNIDVPEVPPLISNVPLSYRSDDSLKNNDCGSTATPFEGNISYKPSPEQLKGFVLRLPLRLHHFSNSQLFLVWRQTTHQFICLNGNP